MNIEQEDGDDEEAEVNVLVVPVLVRTKISTEGSGFTNTNTTQPSCSYSAGRLTHPERPRHLCRAAYWQKTVLWLFISSHCESLRICFASPAVVGCFSFLWLNFGHFPRTFLINIQRFIDYRIAKKLIRTRQRTIKVNNNCI